MDAVRISVKDYVDERRPVIECARQVGDIAAAHLRSGGSVVLSVAGVRGVSSSFFNVILSAVAEALRNDFSDGRFDVELETPTQRLVYLRSRAALIR